MVRSTRCQVLAQQTGSVRWPVVCEEEVNSSTHRSGVSIRTDLLMEYEVTLAVIECCIFQCHSS